ncbi:MAG: leucine--tRNA ligase, partial [Gammaproteobacteria bacterium]|nr:leucine--tRNA ligase [Gammaproteobacteria bacterium]
ERDFAFATNYGLPVKPVIQTSAADVQGSTNVAGGRMPGATEVPAPWQEAYAEHGTCINSGKYDGLDFDGAVDAIAADLSAKNLGEKKVTWRLRDWGISRQRYWGTPIPMIRCDSCGDVPVPEDQLPVVLPDDCVPDGSGNPLNKNDDFLKCTCPECGAEARRETDTMDTFVDSSWYFARYTCTDAESMVDERVNHWMPVDQYVGGIEHAILHLLYSRFWTKVMRDMGLSKVDEPFMNLLTQGMVIAPTFYRQGDDGRQQWINPADVDVTTDEKGRPVSAILKADGQPVVMGGIEKMAKSKNNGVDPQSLIEKYGADTARVFMMFAAPPEQSLEWNDSGVEGAHRFLKRLWIFCGNNEAVIKLAAQASLDFSQATDEQKATRREIHSQLKQALFDFGKYQFNTVIAACMKMLNVLHDAAASDNKQASHVVIVEGVSILLRLLSPVAPHIAHSLWRELGFGDDILSAAWPEVDESALVRDSIELVVQVNGKLRGKINVPANTEKEVIEQLALNDENVKAHTEGKTIRKVIVVPGRLVNLVVS